MCIRDRMISNQVLQNTLEGLKEISRTEFCVLDTDVYKRQVHCRKSGTIGFAYICKIYHKFLLQWINEFVTLL